MPTSGKSPFSVANYFIEKSIKEKKPITPMQVNKLVFLAHAWHLALKGEPLIREEIQAWKYGPVVESLYHALKSYGNKSIDFPISKASPLLADPDTVQILDRVWSVFSGYTAAQLSAMTHRAGSPWDTIWNKEGGRNEMSAEIPDALIEEYYVRKAKAKNAA